jgi:glycosyltransferase involved in cell wall biosynthesis
MVSVQPRVLHVLPTRAKEYGGPVAVAEALARECRQLGWQASVFPALPDEASPDAARHLLAAVRASDMVHVHGLWHPAGTLAAMAARWSNKPYVLTPHGMLDHWALARSRTKKRLYGALFERRNIAGAARLHFLNTEELAEARDYGEAFDPFVMPNGVVVGDYSALPDRQSLYTEVPELQGKVVALFLGRLHPKKGFAALIPALAEAVKSQPDLHLLIAGPDEGGYKAQLDKLIAQHHLSAHVSFLGMVQGQRKLAALAAADFFVLPSHQEGDSVAVKEAMACALPVIITPACHFPEVLARRAGLVVAPQLEAVTQALVQLAQDASLRQRMGRQARQLIEERYTWHQLGKRLIAVYEQVLHGEPGRSHA